MSESVKVELSHEFLARIAFGASPASPSAIEPINLDFDRNSPMPSEAAATYAFLYAEAAEADGN